MGSVYDRRCRQQQQLIHHKTIFLPLFCRLSLKDIRRRDPSPSSPRVGCMGQLKRSSRRDPSPATPHNRTYSKLRKLFSSKTLLPSTTGINCGSRKVSSKDDRAKVVDVGELDPPLPVVKKAEGNANLWKRRFNGAPIQTLQIRNMTHIAASPPPTV
ncbi:hypothetical protein SASPL_113197 [Salvia splendens]|uniref:Uncharacterized protein n=1 Tax=Salvia splendens TaxID=180675 RepID=A0A8X9A017_SALSN|nr:uncharacterized protein LOC121802619 [Salvia splendens]KAG6422816.1 hypothetical protein SASPL_113197 [Salvia splendens]